MPRPLTSRGNGRSTQRAQHRQQLEGGMVLRSALAPVTIFQTSLVGAVATEHLHLLRQPAVLLLLLRRSAVLQVPAK